MSEYATLSIDSGAHGQTSAIKPKPAPVVLDIHSQKHQYKLTMKLAQPGQKGNRVQNDG